MAVLVTDLRLIIMALSARVSMFATPRKPQISGVAARLSCFAR